MPQSPSDASHSGEGQVREEDGEKFIDFTIPRAFQGHTFALDLVPDADPGEPTGPWTVDFVLCSDFLLHENRTLSIKAEQGHSYLVLGEDLRNVSSVAATYSFPDASAPQKTATLRLVASDNLVQRISVDVPETTLQAAVTVASRIVHGLLDTVTFRTAVPTQVRHVEVKSAGGRSKFLRRYMTVPYKPVVLTQADFMAPLNAPKLIEPALRLYREAVGSSRPHYRLLCLYRAREAILRAQNTNNAALLARDITPSRPVRTVPETDLTREFFPSLVGKRIGAFFDHVRSEFRIPIAHLELDDYDRILLDPTDVRIDHRVDYTNAVLLAVVKQLIVDEVSVMSDNALS